jgi:hypothetical protein
MQGVEVKLHKLQGVTYEKAFMDEIENFKNAVNGVPASDVAVALLLKDGGRPDLLEKLYGREIHVVGSINEDTKIEDLKFQ